MQTNANPAGDIFGGWILYLMDKAASIAAASRARGLVATASVSNLWFLQRVRVGDSVCVYTTIVRTGHTSITIGIEVYVQRAGRSDLVRVTETEIVVVAVDSQRMPRVLTVTV
ncbi:acyl-CoA thioesterase [Acidisphaera sp. S103]|uniref:acyl-CoA thioesterase n=1 Tax=Acidisphaera sp. S103 TaxID=1747223 RepID=UPI0021102BD8|nr:hotdog domain-containing protein [Acidisphaera sp. S103]